MFQSNASVRGSHTNIDEGSEIAKGPIRKIKWGPGALVSRGELNLWGT